MKWLVFVFGFISVVRILKTFDEKEYFTKSALTKIGTAYVLVEFLLFQVLKTSPTLLVISNAFLVLAIGCLPLFIVKRREERLLTRLVEKLEMLHLFLQMGDGFRVAFQGVIRAENDPVIQSQLTKMYCIVTFPQQVVGHFRDPRLVFVSQELKRIDQSHYGALQRLKNLKIYQKILSDFRRKSGKVRSQIYLQIWILSGIFVAVACFVAFMFDFERLQKPFFVSSLLVTLGHFIAYKLGRKVKWRL